MTDTLERLKTALAGRKAIARRLGAGTGTDSRNRIQVRYRTAQRSENPHDH